MGLSFIKNCALTLCVMMAMAFIWPTDAQAQVKLYYQCQYGPGQGEVEHHREPQYDNQGRVYGYMIFCVQADQAPQQQQEQQPQSQWIDSYASVVGHADANDIWAAWNVTAEQGGFDGANNLALDACKAAMGDGCAVMDTARNGSIVVMRTHTGYLAASYGENFTQAEVNTYKWCRTNYYSCNNLRSVAAEPWKEYGSSGQGVNKAQLFDPSKNAGGVPRNLHGAVAWAIKDGSMAMPKVWMSGGNKTQAEAKAAVLKNCEADLAKAGLVGKCEVPLIAANQIIVVATDEKKVTRVSSGDDLADAEWKMQVWQCRDTKLTCTTVTSFDAKKEGNMAFDVPL
jgi:Domain of unknown function (DUF4189)